jgi:two-component system response regulator YesN
MYGFNDLLTECVCINIKPFKNQDGVMEETLTSSKKILDFIRENFRLNSISFIHYLCNVIIYLVGEDTKEAKRIADEIKNRINVDLHMEVDIGISQTQHNYLGISKAYRQTEKAISASVILGRNSCITYDEYAGIKKANQGNTEINWQDFVFSVENCLESKVEEYINEYTNLIKKAGVTDTEYLKLMAMNMLSKAATVLTRHGKSLGQLVGDTWLYEEVSKIETVREMNVCLKNIIRHILKYSDSLRMKKSNKLVDQAMEYINAHLYEQSLTLKSIAAKVYTNESYLSRVFKQEVGESLIEYINRKRIEQSIVLLNTTDLKAYEIAEKVGISDPHYFSICFKKHVGVTIKEYKKPKF